MTTQTLSFRRMKISLFTAGSPPDHGRRPDEAEPGADEHDDRAVPHLPGGQAQLQGKHLVVLPEVAVVIQVRGRSAVRDRAPRARVVRAALEVQDGEVVDGRSGFRGQVAAADCEGLADDGVEVGQRQLAELLLEAPPRREP